MPGTAVAADLAARGGLPRATLPHTLPMLEASEVVLPLAEPMQPKSHRSHRTVRCDRSVAVVHHDRLVRSSSINRMFGSSCHSIGVTAKGNISAPTW